MQDGEATLAIKSRGARVHLTIPHNRAVPQYTNFIYSGRSLIGVLWVVWIKMVFFVLFSI
jgi:hypothetical protein